MIFPFLRRYSNKSEVRLYSESLQQLSRNLEEICEKMVPITRFLDLNSQSIFDLNIKISTSGINR